MTTQAHHGVTASSLAEFTWLTVDAPIDGGLHLDDHDHTARPGDEYWACVRLQRGRSSEVITKGLHFISNSKSLILFRIEQPDWSVSYDIDGVLVVHGPSD